MARIARVVVPGVPHHVTQRGNRRQKTFFSDEDYEVYIELMAEWCAARGVEVWAYCLMPNHVHLVAVPESEDGLRRAIGEAHRRYSRRVNFREGWRGHLWGGRGRPGLPGRSGDTKDRAGRWATTLSWMAWRRCWGGFFGGRGPAQGQATVGDGDKYDVPGIPSPEAPMLLVCRPRRAIA